MHPRLQTVPASSERYQSGADAGEHGRQIDRAERHGGYIHQVLHRVTGLTDRVVQSVPKSTGMYLIGEGRIVHTFDPKLASDRGVTMVAVDRELPEQPVSPVSLQVRCDLIELAHAANARCRMILRGTEPKSRRELPEPGTFFASHIGRYLPSDVTQTLIDVGLDMAVPGGNLWLVDTPLCTRLRKASGSPGFDEAYRVARSRDDVRIAVDEVIAPILPKGLYHKINALRGPHKSTEAEHEAFFEGIADGDIRFVTLPSSGTDESVFREEVSARSFRVNGWGVRAMMLEKQG